MGTLPKKNAEVKVDTLHVGVDLGLEQNVAVALGSGTQRLARFGFAHTRQGYDEFHEWLAAVRTRTAAQQVKVAMEPTHYFWKLLAQDLAAHQQPYWLVNPYTVKKHREGDQLDRARDDQRDAHMIADLLRTDKLTHTQLLQGDLAELRQYARQHHRLVAEIGRQKTLLRVAVGQAFPELRQAFKDLCGQTARALLRCQPCALRIRQETQADFLAGVRRQTRAKRLALGKLRQAYALAQTSVGLQDGLEALTLAIQQHLASLEHGEAQLAAVTQALLATFQRLPAAACWLTVPGLGPRTAALLLAEIGDPHAFRQVRQWIKLAGTQPTPNQSGRKSASLTPMSGKGRPRLRTLTYFACLRLIQLDPGFAQRYQALQQRAHNPLNKLQALGVLMNKLLRILWALYQQQTPYDPAVAWPV